jgi:hypothetical protein
MSGGAVTRRSGGVVKALVVRADEDLHLVAKIAQNSLHFPFPNCGGSPDEQVLGAQAPRIVPVEAVVTDAAEARSAAAVGVLVHPPSLSTRVLRERIRRPEQKVKHRDQGDEPGRRCNH